VDREVAERVNGWLREIVDEYGVVGSRAVTLLRLTHDLTLAEKRHLDQIRQINLENELALQVVRPGSAIIITGIS
jgi:hypothetical protein